MLVTRAPTLLEGTWSAAALVTGPARADATVTINARADDGVREGWGTSVAYNGTTLPGLGLNIARYNLGACGWNSVNGETMVASPNIPRFKQIEGFWQDGNSEDPASPVWNWNVDAKQRAAPVKAVQRGATAELFANSPMWWMCLNHIPSGPAGVGYAAAAYDPAVRRLVIVAVNTGAAQTLTFDLSGFSQANGGSGGVVPRWSTVPAGGDRYTGGRTSASAPRSTA